MYCLVTLPPIPDPSTVLALDAHRICLFVAALAGGSQHLAGDGLLYYAGHHLGHVPLIHRRRHRRRLHPLTAGVAALIHRRLHHQTAGAAVAYAQHSFGC